MADEPFIRQESHETVWRLWSAEQVETLIALPTAALVLAVQTGAIADLTEDDQRQVLASLAGRGHEQPVTWGSAKLPPQRRPLPLAGKELPYGPRAQNQHRRTRILNRRTYILTSLALAVTGWVATVWFGYDGITSPIYMVP